MISFDEKNHIYKIDDVKFTSVTTMLSSWFKPFDANKAIESIRKYKNNPKYDTMTDDEIKQSWMDIGKNASSLGTNLHADIESYLSGKEVNNNSTEYKYFLDFINDYKLKTKAMEYTVYYKPIKLVGTIDYITKNDDGTIDLYDWKRSFDIVKSYGCAIHPDLRHIPDSKYWKYTIQLNMYKYLMEKNGEKVKHMFIVCFHPDNDKYVLYKVENIDLTTILERI